MRLFRSVLLAGLMIVGAGSFIGHAQTPVAQNLADVKWGPAPPMLPAGAQIAVLEGDPGKPAPFTARLKFPANYAIPAHSHPTDEHVVVVSGTFYVGMGQKLDKAAGAPMAVGAVGILPSGMNHFAYTKTETTIVLYGQGPVDFKYVNPSDDPRNRK